MFRSEKIYTIPNLLSLFRLALIPVIVCLYRADRDLAAFAVLLLSGLTDIVDGWVARRFDMVSDLGKVLDPVADKLTQILVLLFLAFQIPRLWIIVSIQACKELMMLIAGWIVLRRTGAVHSAKWFGKANTVVIYTTMALHILWKEIPAEVTLVCVIVCICCLAFSCAAYMRRYHLLLTDFESGQEG